MWCRWQPPPAPLSASFNTPACPCLPALLLCCGPCPCLLQMGRMLDSVWRPLGLGAMLLLQVWAHARMAGWQGPA